MWGVFFWLQWILGGQVPRVCSSGRCDLRFVDLIKIASDAKKSKMLQQKRCARLQPSRTHRENTKRPCIIKNTKNSQREKKPKELIHRLRSNLMAPIALVPH